MVWLTVESAFPPYLTLVRETASKLLKSVTGHLPSGIPILSRDDFSLLLEIKEVVRRGSAPASGLGFPFPSPTQGPALNQGGIALSSNLGDYSTDYLLSLEQ